MTPIHSEVMRATGKSSSRNRSMKLFGSSWWRSDGGAGAGKGRVSSRLATDAIGFSLVWGLFGVRGGLNKSTDHPSRVRGLGFRAGLGLRF